MTLEEYMRRIYDCEYKQECEHRVLYNQVNVIMKDINPLKLPRQPSPVTIDFSGDPRDTETYIRKITRVIENGSFDNVTRVGNRLKIYPGAVND